MTRNACSIVAAVLVASSACSNGDGGSDAGSCASDPLETKLPALFNGNSVDMYDCPILTLTAKYNEPDAMIFKAIIYVESRFQFDAVGCTGNTACCPQSNWTDAECACLGADWASSCFNPEVAIELGISGIASNRAQVKKQFPGCTEEQYTMMAIGNFNSYGSTKSCTVYNTTYDNAVLDAYKQYSTASGWAARAY